MLPGRLHFLVSVGPVTHPQKHLGRTRHQNDEKKRLLESIAPSLQCVQSD